jgi:two-component system, NtrC family, sensor kinase
MRKIFAALLLLTAFKGFSQTHVLDSLKKAIDLHEKNDSAKVHLLYNYSWYLYNEAYNSTQRDYSKSLHFTREGINLANEINRPDLASLGNLGAGDIYMEEDFLDSAILMLLEGLNIAERLKLKNQLPEFYSNLGESYRLSEQLKLSEFYDHKYYNLVLLQKNDTLLLHAFDLLISVNDQKGNSDTIRILLDKALVIATRLNDKHQLTRLFVQKGDLYKNQKKYQEAVNLFHEACIYSSSNDHRWNTYILAEFSDAFLGMNNKDSARWYGYAAVDSAKKYHLVKELGDAYESLFNYLQHFGEYKQALETRLLLDSINVQKTNLQTGQTIKQAEMKYAQEKKDILVSIEQSNKEASARRAKNIGYGITAAFILLASFLFYNNRQKQRAKIRIEKAYGELKTTQKQLIQSEKMASLGELTAGIAHEIQNPLNFVNNFSDLNTELLEETSRAIREGHGEEALALITSMTDNEKKINHHGRRADTIVKGMLQHSRSDKGVSEPTDINALTGEYLRLCYHGIRARESLFNARLETAFDPTAGMVQIIPQDFGRVLLNIYNNAFYAVMEKKKNQDASYEPTVSLTTKKNHQQIIITVRDNGNGVPKQVQDKIFQPFFTTKPTGQGTGLGLSLSYDIVKAHGGEIRLITSEGEFTEFVILIPA